MENLSKENFWDDIKKRYPQAMDLFSKWIDKYKVEVGWDRLFANGAMQSRKEVTDEGYRIIGETKNTKFHDIPFEMQNGILARFDIECFNGVLTGKGKAVYENGRPNYVQGFYNLFADLQAQLTKQKQ